MSIACAPENMSLLNPNEFKVYIHKAPLLTFFVQTVALPSINLPAVHSENPFTRVPMSGDQIDWEPLSVVFLVDEDLNGWRECYSWMRGLGFPESFDEYMAMIEDRDMSRFQNLHSPISVVTNTGSRNANIEYYFEDAIPTMVSAPTLTTTNEDQPVVTAKVSFDYTMYDVKPIKAK